MAGAALTAVLATAAATSAQKNPYRNYTEEKFVQNMQSADRNYAAVKTFVAKTDYESAKAQLTRAREQMALTITFWRDARKDDALAMLRKAQQHGRPRRRAERRTCRSRGCRRYARPRSRRRR